MAQRQALEISLDVFKQPLLARKLHQKPLPDGVLTVIKIAAGENPNELAETAAATAQQAASHFLQHILLSGESDHYRQLGLRPDATLNEVREHRKWLLKWLHPDRNHNLWESTLFARVQTAAAAIEKSKTSNQATVAHTPISIRHRRRAPRQLRSRRTIPRRKIILHFLQRLALVVTFFLICYFATAKLTGHQGEEFLADFWPNNFK